ncbi:hypothetical protein [Xenorhabdus bovienii]|uniref:hypothetical protein n=1 Tax=Xenorhabdus bovienii TaxID=40576 RepID=UPI0023B31D7D|nr:hypothetical protein [Xenorhabdus bovienii]MDE9586984.1 hypothetical protein [Xenorhabdus bovienii]
MIRKVDLSSLSKPINVLFIISFLINLVQLFLFLFTNRLPALAYGNSLSVRFGSFLDDPNGFGLLCIIFIGWVHVKYQHNKLKRIAAQFAIILMILMTQSLTILSLSFIIYIFLYARDISFVLCSVFVTTILFFIVPDLDEKLWQIYELKKGSIDDHTSISINLNHAIEFIFGGKYIPLESWWISSFLSNGAVFTLFIFVIGVVVCTRLFKQYKRTIDIDERAVLFSIFLFSLSFMVGSLNLPFFNIFPLNFLYLTLLLMSFKRKFTIKNDRS